MLCGRVSSEPADGLGWKREVPAVRGLLGERAVRFIALLPLLLVLKVGGEKKWRSSTMASTSAETLSLDEEDALAAADDAEAVKRLGLVGLALALSDRAAPPCALAAVVLVVVVVGFVMLKFLGQKRKAAFDSASLWVRKTSETGASHPVETFGVLLCRCGRRSRTPFGAGVVLLLMSTTRVFKKKKKKNSVKAEKNTQRESIG